MNIPQPTGGSVMRLLRQIKPSIPWLLCMLGMMATANPAKGSQAIVWFATKLGPQPFSAQDMPQMAPPSSFLNDFIQTKRSPSAQAPSRQFYLLTTGDESQTSSTWRQTITQQGIEILGQVDHHVWLTQATEQQIQIFTSLSNEIMVMPLPSALKIDPALLEFQENNQWHIKADNNNSEPMEVLLEIYAEHVEPLLQPFQSMMVIHSLIPPTPHHGRQSTVLRVQLASSMLLPLLQHIPQILYIEPYQPHILLNAVENNFVQAGRNNPINTPIWRQNISGQDQIIAIADSGLDTNSCFFAAERIREQNVYNLRAPSVPGVYLHGTHVAGTALGNNINQSMLGQEDGVAPNANLIFQRIGNPDNAESIVVGSDLAELLQPAYDANARIHTNSWGTSGNAYTLLARSVDSFVYEHPEMVVLFAAGNSGTNAMTNRIAFGSVGSPATAKNIITVGALDVAPFQAVAPFSSRGPTADGRIKPTLMAPGTNVLSARSGTSCDVIALQGTSMATPAVAGAAALVRSYFTRGYYPTGISNPTDSFQPSAALIKATLLAAASALPNANVNLGDMHQGFGSLGLDQALAFQERLGMFWVQDTVRTVTTGQIETVSFAVRDNGLLRVALTWTDPPPLSLATKALVNNIDLRLTTPDGRVYLGNVFQQQFSIPGGNADVNNVEEVISLNSAKGGIYRLEIIGASVPEGPQPFALAIVGDFAIPPTQTIPSSQAMVTQIPVNQVPLQATSSPMNQQSTKQEIPFSARAYPLGCQQSTGQLEWIMVLLYLTELYRRFLSKSRRIIIR